MKRYIFLSVLLLLCLSGTACAKDSSKNMDHKQAVAGLFGEQREIVIDCFGDSITWGQFNSEELDQKIKSGEVTPSLDDGGQLFEDYGIYISSVYQSDPTYPKELEMQLNQKLAETGDSRLGENPEIWESYPRLEGPMRSFPNPDTYE